MQVNHSVNHSILRVKEIGRQSDSNKKHVDLQKTESKTLTREFLQTIDLVHKAQSEADKKEQIPQKIAVEISKCTESASHVWHLAYTNKLHPIFE